MPFFLLKGLSFLPFGGLLKNPKVIIGAIIIALLAFGYIKWKSSIKQAIFNQIYTEQAEQHIENQRREMERTQQLMNESNRAVRQAQERRHKLLTEIEQARSHTRNVSPEDNGDVAPVLSDALDFIRARQGSPVPLQGSPVPQQKTFGDKVGEVVDDGAKALQGAQESATETGNSFIDAWKKKRGKS
jgi:type II secretory pathway pseudopilin PulG